MAYCSTRSPNWQEYRLKYSPEYWSRAAEKDTEETLYIDTRWVVLYVTEEQKIPADRVRNCLRALNLIYGGKNTDELNKVPNTARNPWKPVVGNPNIQFLPLDESTLKVEYQKITSSLSGEVPVQDAASRGEVIPGVLNIYISISGQGSILGQAELNANIVYALYSAVGGYEVRGTLPGYDMGKTVAHEVGHALGLVHTFSDSTCDGFAPYLDVPECIRPNFSTQLFQLADGSWDQKNDNRYLDRINGTHLSCLHIESNPETAPNEQGINIMDYGSDEVSLMFSKNQALMMRTYLQSSENTDLTLKSASDKSISAMSASSEEVTNPSGALVGTETSGDNEAASFTMSTTVLVVIIVIGSVVFLGLVYAVYRVWWKPKSVDREESPSHKKASLSYASIPVHTL